MSVLLPTGKNKLFSVKVGEIGTQEDKVFWRLQVALRCHTVPFPTGFPVTLWHWQLYDALQGPKAESHNHTALF